jgi:hypothetical protein
LGTSVLSEERVEETSPEKEKIEEEKEISHLDVTMVEHANDEVEKDEQPLEKCSETILNDLVAKEPVKLNANET